MDRRKTTLIALTATGVVAASAAVLLTVPTTGAIVPTEPEAAAAVVEPTDLWGTMYAMPEGYVSFYLDWAGDLQSYGDVSEFDETTLQGITDQLKAAPPQSALIVETASLDSDGLTTVLTTVTPTNGLTLATTNEEMQAWLVGLFPGVEGTPASLPVANVPNASFSYSQGTEELAWTVTEHVFQFGDATVSAIVSTTDATGQTATDVDAILASMTRG